MATGQRASSDRTGHVNRYWQTIFERPLLPPEILGLRAATTHPDLLSWLAKDFVDHGWNVKRTIKQMVMSSTITKNQPPDLSTYKKTPLISIMPVPQISSNG